MRHSNTLICVRGTPAACPGEDGASYTYSLCTICSQPLDSGVLVSRPKPTLQKNKPYPFLWYKHSYHSQFQVINMMPMNAMLGRDVQLPHFIAFLPYR